MQETSTINAAGANTITNGGGLGEVARTGEWRTGKSRDRQIRALARTYIYQEAGGATEALCHCCLLLPPPRRDSAPSPPPSREG